ncbi:kama family protein [Byssothecium circinans]|uniref:Kama family protein n=1 Tax=Byssothecium circinans TaxID=147558 RepID=A0A6A5UG76_9PLEO|nr:kama family protein [Byssothecium circinans]
MTTGEERYWSHIPRYSDVPTTKFINWDWQVFSIVDTKKLSRLLEEVLPEKLGVSRTLPHIQTKQDFIHEVEMGLKEAPMSIRLTPHVISRINWQNPVDDPLRRQFIPIKSGLVPDHPQLTFDSLNEQEDCAVDGLIHRYPGKALFLPISVCPVYCRFCTRSWAVGGNTDLINKESQRPILRRWEKVFQHIEHDPSIEDIVVSGGDSYQLLPDQLRIIGERLLSIPHIRRFRIASKGIAVAPGRILDKADRWVDEIIALSNRGREMGKQVCIHTHFNHPNEITWITRKAAAYLFSRGVIVRNQSVLLKGVNDDLETMSRLIKSLADLNVEPYYVYQCDLVRGVEDLRTPLRTILELEKRIRGTLTGFMMPSFVVDLPGGGGKRLASTHEKYDEINGVSFWRAPGLPGQKGKQIYTYYDPFPKTKVIHERQRKLVKATLAQMNEQLRLPGTDVVEDNKHSAAETVGYALNKYQEGTKMSQALAMNEKLGSIQSRGGDAIENGLKFTPTKSSQEMPGETIANKNGIPAKSQEDQSVETNCTIPIEREEEPQKRVASAGN